MFKNALQSALDNLKNLTGQAETNRDRFVNAVKSAYTKWKEKPANQLLKKTAPYVSQTFRNVAKDFGTTLTDYAASAHTVGGSGLAYRMGLFPESKKYVESYTKPQGLTNENFTPTPKAMKQTVKSALIFNSLQAPQVYPMAASFGSMLGGGIQAAKNILATRPLTYNMPQAIQQSTEYSLKTAPTLAFTNQLVNKFAQTIPALNPLTEEGIKKTLPQASQTLGQWVQNLGKTAVKRIFKAAAIESPIEGITYGYLDKKPDESFMDSVADEFVENLIFNVGIAGANLAWDARTAGSLIKKSAEDVLQRYSMSPFSSESGAIELPKVSIDTSKKAYNINKDRLNLNKGERYVLDKIVESNKPELEKLKGQPLTHQEVINAAKTSEMLQQTTTRQQTMELEAQLLKARQKLVELDKEVASLTKSGDTKAAKQKTQELVELLRVVSSNAADRGRQLNALKIQAEDEGIRTAVLREIGKVETDTNKIAEEAAKVDWENANSVTKFYRKFIKAKASDVITEYRYNNMLSNPRTHLRNAFSNMTQTFFTRPATIALTGDLKGAAKYYQGALESFPKATKAFMDSYTGKAEITKPDLRYQPTTKLPRFMTIPTRAMEAGDKFFRELVMGGEIARGTDKKTAKEIAEYSLFRQDLFPKQQGVVLDQIDKMTSAVYSAGNKAPALRWFVPFIKTPMNFVKQWLEYSPAGVTTAIGAKNVKEQLAKSVLGSMVSSIGAYLALNGRTTWSVPTNEKQKELFWASGRKPYSVKVGDRWVSMNYFGPFTWAIALPAAAKHYFQDQKNALTESDMDKASKAMSSLMELFSGQTYMEGLEQFVMLFQGKSELGYGKSLMRNFGYTSSQVIPFTSLIRWINTAIDPIYRKSSGFVDELRKSIPGGTFGLEPYTEPSGEVSKRENLNLVTPFDVSKSKPEYEQQYQQKTKQLQQKALERAKLEGKSLQTYLVDNFTQSVLDNKPQDVSKWTKQIDAAGIDPKVALKNAAAEAIIQQNQAAYDRLKPLLMKYEVEPSQVQTVIRNKKYSSTDKQNIRDEIVEALVNKDKEKFMELTQKATEMGIQPSTIEKDLQQYQVKQNL